ncbi:MAG: terpene synthase family protein, partial ['Waltheria sp.' little leaf phytoplasma]|nr:terpene synthase family protein ['Waltheria sp.' little leaf phytoplasma]
ADLLKTFIQEARWAKNKQQAPAFEEYIENAWMSASGPLQLVHAYFLLGQNITKEELQCLDKYDDLLRWPSLVFRLCNDLATSEVGLVLTHLNVHNIFQCLLQVEPTYTGVKLFQSIKHELEILFK